LGEFFLRVMADYEKTIDSLPQTENRKLKTENRL